jgi:DNA-binding NarL/FixJ family response regulator
MALPPGIPFTPREKEIIQAVLAAQSNKAIADQLGISEQSVKNRLTQLYRKLGIHSRLELMKILLKDEA